MSEKDTKEEENFTIEDGFSTADGLLVLDFFFEWFEKETGQTIRELKGLELIMFEAWAKEKLSCMISDFFEDRKS